jgi:hypothetical protein
LVHTRGNEGNKREEGVNESEGANGKKNESEGKRPFSFFFIKIVVQHTKMKQLTQNTCLRSFIW